MPAPRVFADLHAQARRLARRPEEADDLLQLALLAALESGRTDLASPETRRWLSGVLRKRAAFDARTSARRRRRENDWTLVNETERSHSEQHPDRYSDARRGQESTLCRLRPSLRLPALLALSGHTRREIGWLLGLSDDALRQRISQLKRALAGAPAPGEAGPTGQLAFGRIRRALLGPLRHPDAFLASHDPDGHLFAISRSQIPRPRQLTGG